MKLRPKSGARVPGWMALVALVVAVACPGAARAQGVQVALMPFQQNVTPGDSANVEIDVTQAGSPFNGYDAVVSYDPAALTYVPRSAAWQQGCQMTGACSAACGNTFHIFKALADSVMITDILLCNQISLTGPGQLYRLHFITSNTPQVTYVRFRQVPVFYQAGLYVTPVSAADCAIGIGVQLGVGGPGPVREGLRVRAEPNPARGAVSLSVEAGAAGEQELRVLDVQGRTVRELSSGWYAGGARRVEWDGRDARGARAPAGVYLVTLRAGTRRTQTRITLLN